ncbi:hypothetical protein NXX23_29280 [Bacteroides ovatus]|nr:hypothetical protein [Bacteroides ovatus]MCS2305191.1 hypothetical protein [Bacteroides ovatus]UVQ64051.1 hypothetical protein NXX44_23395 [Bacteroides ovatus]
MHSDRIPESTKQWLQNEDFILWCLAPTQESEEWWVNYQKEHPEDQASLQEAPQNHIICPAESGSALTRRIRKIVGTYRDKHGAS